LTLRAGGKMKKTIVFILLIWFDLSAFSFDTSGFTKIYQDDNFTFFSEDKKDYSLFIRYIDNENNRLVKIFNKKLKHNTIYVYTDHKSVSRKVFNSDENSPYCGFADIHNNIIYVTSPFDKYKYKTYQDYFNALVHELIHQYYSPKAIWLREGLAQYLSDLYLSYKIIKMPKSFQDFKFYTSTSQDTFQAYNMSGWLVRFIYEERCNRDMNKFILYANNSLDYKAINFLNEKEMFGEFNKYMVIKNIIQTVEMKFTENGLLPSQTVLKKES
jgi:hypothetical protein